MNLRRAFLWGLTSLVGFAAPAAAGGHSIQVPQDHPTIQEAVDAAGDGDSIVVDKGRFCGATITQRVQLIGRHGATIIGCDQPVVGVLRAGFFLPDARASGTRIKGFRFDGQGVSNANLIPLALGVIARSADDLEVTDNAFQGTIQAVTNTDGSGWRVLFNRVSQLTALTCDGQCAGGDAIVFQQRLVLTTRPENNIAAFNHVEGTIPDGLDQFSMVGIFVLGQDGALVLGNRLAIPDNPNAAGEGDGVLVTDHCCAQVVVSTSVKTKVLFNDGRRSEVAVRVDVDASGGAGNLEGAVIFGNRGRVVLPPGAPHPWHARELLAVPDPTNLTRATRSAVTPMLRPRVVY
jgi:hypothetical protein